MPNINIDISISKKESLKTVCKYAINKLYIPFDLFYLGELKPEDITRIHNSTDIKVYLSLPRILRANDDEYLLSLKTFLKNGKADGILVRNLEEIGYLESIEDDLNNEYISLNSRKQDYTPLCIDTDYTLYNWNKSALEFVRRYSVCNTVPMELSIHEAAEIGTDNMVYPIYGYAPLMISKNCIKKTCGDCTGQNNISYNYCLKDRKNKAFPVTVNCIHCYNEIYNSLPTSLHKYIYDLIKYNYTEFRLDFTFESNSDIDKLLTYYITDSRSGAFPCSEYTNAHIQKGAI